MISMPTILKTAGSALLSILSNLATEKFFVWLFFFAAQILVKKTSTPHDDTFLAKVKLLQEKENAKKQQS